MPISVDQLRAQRELVKRHLDWLDARIAESSGEPPGAEAQGRAVGADLAAPGPAGESHADALLEAHAEQSGLSSNAKMGCVAVAVAFVLLFIGMLFVLPKFLYGDKSSGRPDTSSEPGEVVAPADPHSIKPVSPPPLNRPAPPRENGFPSPAKETAEPSSEPEAASMAPPEVDGAP